MLQVVGSKGQTPTMSVEGSLHADERGRVDVRVKGRGRVYEDHSGAAAELSGAGAIAATRGGVGFLRGGVAPGGRE